LCNIFFREDYYDDAGAFAGLEGANLHWHYANVEEGDALYIPPLWWHGIIPANSEFGVTAAVPWRSPLPVIADSLRRMALGEVDVVGKTTPEQIQFLLTVARNLGMEQELVIALKRGV
jgi:hypothetical protein